MNYNDFKPIGALAQNFGVKSVVFGKPGTGKTPLLLTAPNCGAMCVEPGLLSVRGQNYPMAIARYTRAEIEDFFAWLFGSAEPKQKFQTIAIDSVSQWAEIELAFQKGKNRDGRAAYGEMANNVIQKLEKLYFMPNMNIVLLCKLEVTDGGENGMVQRPYFPGKELHVRVPHMFDEIFWLDYFDIPGYGRQRALRTWPTFNAVCRDRSGRLAEYEPPNLADVFAKCLS